MENPMTKAKLLNEMRAARKEWEELLNEVGEARMTETGATGDWSVKDVITHLTSYARWYMNAAEAQLRDEMPAMDGTEQMPFEERNQLYYERDKAMPLAQALHESEQVHQRLLAAVEKLPEAFLIEPQNFPGAPQPTYVWQMLRGDVYDHTRTHIGWIRDWFAQLSENEA
jgi:hypothetical protein